MEASSLTGILILSERIGLVSRIEEFAPDVILIDLGNPQSDELEELFAASRALGPIGAKLPGASSKLDGGIGGPTGVGSTQG